MLSGTHLGPSLHAINRLCKPGAEFRRASSMLERGEFTLLHGQGQGGGGDTPAMPHGVVGGGLVQGANTAARGWNFPLGA